MSKYTKILRDAAFHLSGLEKGNFQKMHFKCTSAVLDRAAIFETTFSYMDGTRQDA